jgi:hypothetical protein
MWKIETQEWRTMQQMIRGGKFRGFLLGCFFLLAGSVLAQTPVGGVSLPDGPSTTKTPLNKLVPLEIVRKKEALPLLSGEKEKEAQITSSTVAQPDFTSIDTETTFVRLNDEETSVVMNLVTFSGCTGVIKMSYTVSQTLSVENSPNGNVVILKAWSTEGEGRIVVFISNGEILAAYYADFTYLGRDALEDYVFEVDCRAIPIIITISRCMYLKDAAEYMNRLQGRQLDADQEKIIDKIVMNTAMVKVSTTYEFSLPTAYAFTKETVKIKHVEGKKGPLSSSDFATLCHFSVNYLWKINPLLSETFFLEWETPLILSQTTEDVDAK